MIISIPLSCHKCGYTWEYKGGSTYRTTCPKCGITVYIDKCSIPMSEYLEIKKRDLMDQLSRMKNVKVR